MEMPFSPSGALIKHPFAGLLLGEGPFRESAVPPESGAAFYVNTFRLDDPLPWKIPAALHSLPEPEDGLPPAPEIRWEAPSPDAYAQVFTEIMGQIASGRLVKSVPATPQFGELQPPHVPRELIRRAFGSSPSHYPYAWWTEKEGFCGASPETLFHQQGRRLTTMALAGTARPEDEGVFINDDKEIREHEIVAGSILSRLSPCGSVSRTPRRVLNLGTLIHFVTYLTLEADRPPAARPLDSPAASHARAGFPATHGGDARPAGRLAFPPALPSPFRRALRPAAGRGFFLPGRHPLHVLAGPQAGPVHGRGRGGFLHPHARMAGTEAEKGDGQAQLPPALISVPSFPFMRKTGFPGPK